MHTIPVKSTVVPVLWGFENSLLFKMFHGIFPQIEIPLISRTIQKLGKKTAESEKWRYRRQPVSSKIPVGHDAGLHVVT